jgi:hypothetical protein
MLSEWIHVFPNEWGVEGPAIIGAYGMGLQGWDTSYLFENGDQARFSRSLGGSDWDVMAPQILGVFPAVSRQVLRGDVQESSLTAVRNVHVPSLFQGKLGFKEQIAQGYDDKELDGSAIPAAALAVARCTVSFTTDWRETVAFDLKKYFESGSLVSSTRQLRWNEAKESVGGFFTVNTPATKAVVGFATDMPCELGEISIASQSRFAAVYVTAIERGATFENAQHLLIVAMGRARNTGMKFSPAGNELMAKGASPVLMEPVRAHLIWRGRPIQQIHVLNHDGIRTGKTLQVQNGQFTLDGQNDQTPYYEIVLR